MSIKLELQSFELGGVAPYGRAPAPGNWNGSIMWHEFTMAGVFKLSLQTSFIGKNTQTMTALSSLSWKEREFWWEKSSAGGGGFRISNDKGDLYQSGPASPTWGGFAQGVTDVCGRPHDVHDQTADLEPGSVVEQWLQQNPKWVAGKAPLPTGWARGKIPT